MLPSRLTPLYVGAAVLAALAVHHGILRVVHPACEICKPEIQITSTKGDNCWLFSSQSDVYAAEATRERAGSPDARAHKEAASTLAAADKINLPPAEAVLSAAASVMAASL